MPLDEPFDNPLLSLKWTATDLGLGLGASRIPSVLKPLFSPLWDTLNSEHSRLKKKTHKEVYSKFRRKFSSIKEKIPRVTKDLQGLSPEEVEKTLKLNKELIEHHKITLRKFKEVRKRRFSDLFERRIKRLEDKIGVGDAYKRVKAFSKQAARIGIGYAAIGLLDFGFTMFFDLMTPGVNREAVERDQLHSDEIYLDSRMAYTQRRRAIQAIHESQISVGRAIIGQEAMYIHQ